MEAGLEDLERLIVRARRGDLDAFAEVTRRFQQMAFGYAVALLRDLQQAEDVVQESFVAAWFGLMTLADPAAFPGWFRGIVRHQAHRLLRQRHLEALPLAAAEAVADGESGPEGRLERRQRIATVLSAIGRLAGPLREVVTLFYVHECTQQDIATFLGLPVTMVNNRLHAARARSSSEGRSPWSRTRSKPTGSPTISPRASAASSRRGKASWRCSSTRPACPTR